MREEFERLLGWFASSGGSDAPTFGPGRADAVGPLAELFRTVDGQLSGGPIFAYFELLSYTDAQAEKSMMDDLARDESWEDSWWHRSWHPFAADGAGQLLVVDERDGRVIEFLHDDECRQVLAETLGAYAADIASRLEGGALVYDAGVGVISPDELANYRAQQAARPLRSASEGAHPTAGLLIVLTMLFGWVAIGIALELGDTIVPIGALVVGVATALVLSWMGWIKSL